MPTEDKIIKAITIECTDDEERMRVGELIHKQLVGNEDYKNNNILLNCTDEPRTVLLYIFEGCKEVPQILI